MLEIEPGASKTAALHAYHSMRHALLSLGYDKDCQELRDLAEAKDTLTDEEEREYYEEEYYIALCAQEDEECVLEDGEASSFSSDLAVLEANLHWRAATRFVSDDESEVDGDLEYASSEADEDTESDSGTDACNADDTDMDEGTDIDDLVDEVDAEPEEGSVDYVRYGCGYEAGSLRSPSLEYISGLVARATHDQCKTDFLLLVYMYMYLTSVVATESSEPCEARSVCMHGSARSPLRTWRRG
ncbi:hypothetical protein LTS09_009618 [Friedmanniomyces endolithicus]|nr:hypothetical protein LTS09_009618 [Friedmanniomyces endolithicus]